MLIEIYDNFFFQNWAFRPENFEQCLDEKNTTKDESTFKEGCRIYGYLEVNRVSGSFHIAPGKSFAVNHVHGICFLNTWVTDLTANISSYLFAVHDVQPHSSEDFNITHHIQHLSFGDTLKGKENPLDGFYTYADKGILKFFYVNINFVVK